MFLLRMMPSFIAFLTIVQLVFAQAPPEIEWAKCYGGSGPDYATCIKQTSDGGYIIAGYSASVDGQVSNNHGDNDYWIVKIEPSGDIQWENSYGGSNDDEAQSIDQTSDGGYIVAGYSNSNDGDVTENHGQYDYWVIRLDSIGALIWQKSFGTSYSDYARSVQQTADGNFVVAGSLAKNGIKNFWILKLDDMGNEIWIQSFGGTNEDGAFAIEQSIDEGYIVAGDAVSTDGDVIGNHGAGDEWILKLDGNGAISWKKCYGGSSAEQAFAVKQASDGDYFVAGFSMSSDGDVSSNNGSHDYWITKIDEDGNLLWQAPLGGSSIDVATSLAILNDGGCIVSGYAASYDGDVHGNHNSNTSNDYWLIRFDSQGDTVWTKCLGGSNSEGAYSIQRTIDCGYIVAGYAYSNDGDVSGSQGGPDYWIVKLGCDYFGTFSVDLSTSIEIPPIYPNPVKDKIYVSLPASTQEMDIYIFDFLGNRIHELTSFSEKVTQINTGELPDGIYTLQILDRKTNMTEVRKFVKHR